MSIVGTAVPIWNGQTGAFRETGEREWTIVYQVQTNDPLDGPATVCAASGIPLLGTFYQIGNDLDPFALLREVTPSRFGNGRNLWHISCRYSNKSTTDEEQHRDEDGNPTNDPNKFYDEIDVSFRQLSAPVEDAVNWTPLLPFRPVGTRGPVVNSAGVIYDPPLDRDRSIMVVRLSRYRPTFLTGLALTYQDAVNSDNFVINKPRMGFTLNVAQYQAKMQSLSGSLLWYPDQNGAQRPYWKMTYELHIDSFLGWRVDVVDRGTHARAAVNDPTGQGTFVAMNQLRPGAPYMRRVKDQTGAPIIEPCLLDGNGQPLALGLPPVFLTYQVYRELPFAVLNL